MELTLSIIALVALGVALLYLSNRVINKNLEGRARFLEGLTKSGSSEAPLDEDLIAKISGNLEPETSDHLRQMLVESSTGRWSPEALEAARLLLDRRLNRRAPEPVYRTVPRAKHEQAAREQQAVASGFKRHLLVLDVGSRVNCPWRGQDGTIIHWNDEEERFYIRLDNGEGEWATLGMF
jgi:hypothetical protein